MGNCHSEEAKSAERAAEGVGELPAVAVPDQAPAVPLWKLVVDEQAVAAEEAEAKRRVDEAENELAEAKKKQEDEEEAKRQQEAKKKEEEEEAAVKAAKKKTSDGKVKKRPSPSPKKTSGKAAEGAEEKVAEEIKEEPEAPKVALPLDKVAIKAREKAFKERPAPEQESLGAKLRMAARESNAAEVKSLLEDGVVPSVTDKDGWTALMEAGQSGSAECCTLLLQYGANPKDAIKLGEWGMTALHYAARKGHLEAAKVLAPVSDLSIKNFQSKTAKEVAKADGYPEIAKICRK